MTEEMTLRVFRCDACSAENETSGETCETCGAAAPEVSGTKFELKLTFAGEECPSCRETSPGGICLGCGDEIPTPEPSPATKARIKALKPLADRARALVASFEDFPDPHITVTPSQLAAAIRDAHGGDRTIRSTPPSDRTPDNSTPGGIPSGTARAVGAARRSLDRVTTSQEAVHRFEQAMSGARCMGPSVHGDVVQRRALALGTKPPDTRQPAAAQPPVRAGGVRTRWHPHEGGRFWPPLPRS